MATETVKNAKMTTESVVNFVFFEMLTTEKSVADVLFCCYGYQFVFTVAAASAQQPVDIYKILRQRGRNTV